MGRPYRRQKESFEGWIEAMLQAVHRQGYPAPNIRRGYIPKPGKQEKRPLGVPSDQRGRISARQDPHGTGRAQHGGHRAGHRSRSGRSHRRFPESHQRSRARGNALIDAGFFGLLGAGVGGLVSPLFPGKVIYRAAGVKPGEHGPKPPPPGPAKPPEKPESAPDATAPEKPQFTTHTGSSGLSESCGPACVHTLHPDTLGEITAGPLRSSCD
jgi:hypothetical protein